MTDELKRPSSFECWLDDIKQDRREGGLAALFPWTLLICIGAGLSVGFIVPDDFWSAARWDVSTAVYAAFLTFNALVLAISWNAFGKIFENACAPGFSGYLREKGLLGHYFYYVDFVHVAQLVATGASAVGLLAIVTDKVPELWERVIFGAMIGLSAYAMKQAAGTVTAMHDIVWYRAIYDAHQAAQAAGNVVPITRNGG